MMLKLRKNAQITIPSSIVKKLKWDEGTYIDCILKDNNIILTRCHNYTLENESNTLTIHCFGRFSIRYNERFIWIKKIKCIELLAYLICEHSGPIKKTKICDVLWPDTNIENALNSLSKIYQYIVKNFPYIPIFSENGSMYLDMHLIDSDLAAFIKLYKTDNIECLKRAVELYKGSVYQDECYDWSIQISSKYEIIYEDILEKLITYFLQQKNKNLVEYYKLKKAQLDTD